ncbi:MAG: hypothetical protein Q7V63_01160 [Gammaproteobacteria bacterium]|nr:hypothetical protein [Gammaproteobacteria bacterium]
MFKSIVGYNIVEFRNAIAEGDLAKIDACLTYFKKKGKLDEMLCSWQGTFEIKYSDHYVVGNPIFEAFRNINDPRYAAAIMLLKAGTDPCYVSWAKNIICYAINYNSLRLLRLLMWFVDDYEKMLATKIVSTTVGALLADRERRNPGFTAKVEAAFKDAQEVKALLAQAKELDLDKAVPIYARAAELYAKNAALEHLPEYEGHEDIRRHYCLEAYAIYQSLDEAYHRLTDLSLKQKKHHLAITKNLATIFRYLSPKEANFYEAYAKLLEHDLRPKPEATQAAFFEARESVCAGASLSFEKGGP